MSPLPQIRTILYVTDLGDYTRPVFLHALSLARAYGANVVMLHVVEPLGNTGEAVLSAYLTPDLRRKIEKDGLHRIIEQMQTRLERFRQEEHELAEMEQRLVSDVVVAQGRADEEILEQAGKYQADLIVIGSNTGGHQLLGSTARRITQRSQVPVLVVPNVRG